MDEFNSGMEPEVRRYFRKIVNSLVYGIIWLLAVIAAGLFFDLGGIENGVQWYNILFYLLAIASFIFLVVYYIRSWSGRKN